jgi:hypothetical protein
MRVIVKISSSHQGAGGSGARYIEERSRNPERETSSNRVLFTPEEDTVKWRGADSYLKGKANGRPRSGNLLHVILSFQKEDAHGLEQYDSKDRDNPYRIIARETITKMSERLKVTGLRWVAGVHRHTKHPHLHILIHKEVKDAETGERKRISRLPQEMLNDRDPATGKPVAGLINLDASETIDHLLTRQRAVESDVRDVETARQISTQRTTTAQNLSTLRPEETEPIITKDKIKDSNLTGEKDSLAVNDPKERSANGNTKSSLTDLTSQLKNARTLDSQENTSEHTISSPVNPAIVHAPEAPPAQFLSKTAVLPAQFLSSQSPISLSNIEQGGQSEINFQPAEASERRESETPGLNLDEIEGIIEASPYDPNADPSPELEHDEISDFDR